jgi:hypothetical protein
MEQLEPAASVEPQAFVPVESAKSLGLAPVMVGTMLFSAAVPVLDNVAASAAEVVPTGVFGKAPGELKVAAAAVPVPESAEVCGEPVALSATESVAEKLVAEAGVKVTYMEQDDPAASVEPQAFTPVEIAKSLGLAPVMLGTMLFNALVPVFDSVAAMAAEVVPAGVPGKEREEVKVAVVPPAGASSWNDSAQEPEMPTSV